MCSAPGGQAVFERASCPHACGLQPAAAATAAMQNDEDDIFGTECRMLVAQTKSASKSLCVAAHALRQPVLMATRSRPRAEPVPTQSARHTCSNSPSRWRE